MQLHLRTLLNTHSHIHRLSCTCQNYFPPLLLPQPAFISHSLTARRAQLSAFKLQTSNFRLLASGFRLAFMNPPR
jgi:hypothetical protein